MVHFIYDQSLWAMRDAQLVNGTTQANYDAQQLQTTGGQTSSDRAASTRLKYNKNHKEAEGLELFLAVLAEHQDQQNQSVFSPTYWFNI